MGLALACVVRMLHDDWSIRLGENRPYRALKHLSGMLFIERQSNLITNIKVILSSDLHTFWLYVKHWPTDLLQSKPRSFQNVITLSRDGEKKIKTTKVSKNYLMGYKARNV